LAAQVREAGYQVPSGLETRRQNVLALSGGGTFGAYTAGVLNGWSATGQRPPFDVVTGISTGALAATYAFLGPEYDRRLCQLSTSITAADIYRRRPRLTVLWSDAVASSAPLARLLEGQIDATVLQAVAVAHAQGRRLYVGTTNLDTRRLVVWDMGAIASSGRPDALELYRKVVLASASVPGFFPPVRIDVQVNGQTYTELHADGGATSEVFLRSSMLHVDVQDVRAGRRPLAGSDVYVIIAGKLFSDPECVRPRVTGVGAGALGALTYAQTRNDVARIYTLALLTGMRFHLAALPQEFPTTGDSLSFDQEEMRRLYAEGYREACAGQAWHERPPAVDPAEQSAPRGGTAFLAPAGCRR
jgi:predicted acylesterase/phospholipase RssA